MSNVSSGRFQPEHSRRRARRAATLFAVGTLGVSAALGLSACGEDREGGSVEEIGPGTTGTGTGTTVPVEPTTGETTGATTTGETTATGAAPDTDAE